MTGRDGTRGLLVGQEVKIGVAITCADHDVINVDEETVGERQMRFIGRSYTLDLDQTEDREVDGIEYLEELGTHGHEDTMLAGTRDENARALALTVLVLVFDDLSALQTDTLIKGYPPNPVRNG